MRYSSVLFFPILWSLFSVVSPSSAGFILAFTSTGEVGNFEVEHGSTIAIPVYLVQTGGEQRLSTVGLFSAGATVEYQTNSGPVGSAIPISIELNPLWTDSVANLKRIELDNNRVILEGVVLGLDPVSPPINSNAVQIGEVYFAAGAVNNLTSLNVSLDGNLEGINLLIAPATTGTPILPTFVGGSIFTITAVPEPTSLLLVGTATGLIFCTRLRTRRPRSSISRD
jgi:hypothetical protein